LLRYDRSGLVRHAGAHEDMLVYRSASATVEVIATSGTWVGATADISDGLEDGEFRLEPGDVLLLYTDGAIEAQNSAGEQFGLSRLSDVLLQNAGLTPGSLVKVLLGAISDFMDEQHDDVSLVVLRYSGN